MTARLTSISALVSAAAAAAGTNERASVLDFSAVRAPCHAPKPIDLLLLFCPRHWQVNWPGLPTNQSWLFARLWLISKRTSQPASSYISGHRSRPIRYDSSALVLLISARASLLACCHCQCHCRALVATFGLVLCPFVQCPRTDSGRQAKKLEKTTT